MLKPFLSSFTIITFAGMTLCTPLALAQQGPIDTAKKQIPTNKKGVEQTAEQIAKRVEIDKKKQQEILRKAKLVREQHAAHLAAIKAGKVNPYQRFFNAYQTLSNQLPELQKLHNQWLETSDITSKQLLAQQLLTKIQPLGSWLQTGNYVEGYDAKFTADKLKEFERLERDPQRRPAKLSESQHQLEYTSPTAHWFTLQKLPVPVACKAPPNARVYLQATQGGQFENGLSIIEKTADKNGNINTFWLSQGDAIGMTQVKIISPQCSNIIYYNINVVQLGINYPATLNTERMKQLLGQSPQTIHQMLKKFTKLDLSKTASKTQPTK